MRRKKRLTVLQATRAYCLRCQGWIEDDEESHKPVKAVRECPSLDCDLYPFRLGKDPFRKRNAITKEQKYSGPPYINKSKHQCVYFIGSLKHQQVKIGYTISGVEKRKKRIESEVRCDLEIFKKIDGGTPSLEKYLHDKFKHFNIHGEWFRIVPEIFLFDEIYDF